MKALTWQGSEKVEVVDVPDPVIQEPTDAILRVTSTAICGSDLHLYKPLGPYLDKGDVLGHEFMGVVEEVGPQAGDLRPGDRVVIPFNISCGHCWMCTHGLQSQCQTTQVRDQDKGAALFGYTRMYGSVPGGQAEYVRVPQAHYGPVKLPAEGTDERFLFLSDILPTAWQGVKYADVQEGSTIVVYGLGPVGQLATRCAKYLGAARVIGVDLVADRLEEARRHGVEVLDITDVDDPAAAIREMTDDGADGVVEAVGMEAHGGPADTVAGIGAAVTGKLPDPLARKAMESFGVDRTAALTAALRSTRRGGTVSISGVYGGAADPLPMAEMFDRQVTIRMGQANVRRWSDELRDILIKEDAFDCEGLRTHRLPLTEAARAYEMFQKKEDGCRKVVLDPAL